MTPSIGPLAIRSDLAELEGLFSYVERFCAQHGLSVEAKHRILLVAEELTVNAIEHGHRGSRDGHIEIGLAHDPGGIALTIADDAPPFDPLSSSTPPDLRASIDDRTVGGLGVHLVRTLATSVHYRFDGRHNIVSVSFAI